MSPFCILCALWSLAQVCSPEELDLKFVQILKELGQPLASQE